MANVKREQSIANQGEALRLRLTGMGYAKIAEMMGYATPSGAHQAVQKALKRTVQEPADELRQMESDRMDAMLNAMWPRVEKGDPRAVEVSMKVAERRAKLLGLDAPEQLEAKQDITVKLVNVSIEDI